MSHEIDKETADVAIEIAEMQEAAVALAERHDREKHSTLAENLSKRESLVREFRTFFRETLSSFAAKSGMTIKALGIKGIHLCQERAQKTSDILTKNELAHVFYEEYLRLQGTFLGKVSKDLYEANRSNIELLKQTITREAIKGGQFFQGVGSQIASIEYQEKIDELVKRIEEIYHKILINYKNEFVPETKAIIEDGLKAAGLGAKKAAELSQMILARLRKEPLQVAIASKEKD